MICPSCMAQAPSSAATCPGCGASLRAPRPGSQHVIAAPANRTGSQTPPNPHHPVTSISAPAVAPVAPNTPGPSNTPHAVVSAPTGPLLPVGVTSAYLVQLTEHPYRTGSHIAWAINNLLSQALGATTPDIVADNVADA